MAESKSITHGVYSDLISDYISYKQSLGFKMSDVQERLRPLDKLATDMGLKAGGISKELSDAWGKPRPMESEQARYGRISLLRGFSAYLQILGYESYMPRLPKVKSSFSPHIFTAVEMEAIFRECDKLVILRKYTYSMKCVMPCLIRMLYGTGIRIGEAARLTHADVNLTDGILTLRGTKNGQDRLVPMSLSLREVCKDYIAYKESNGCVITGEKLFFTSSDGTHNIKPQTIYEIFRAVLLRAGIPHGGRGKGARLHDLRHTFCVRSLVKMSEAGYDLYHTMPILMTYMGHQSLDATNRYVRMTREMYPNLIQKVNGTYKYIFPELEYGLIDNEYEAD